MFCIFDLYFKHLYFNYKILFVLHFNPLLLLKERESQKKKKEKTLLDGPITTINNYNFGSEELSSKRRTQ
jgi:hypothetical protein